MDRKNPYFEIMYKGDYDFKYESCYDVDWLTIRPLQVVFVFQTSSWLLFLVPPYQDETFEQ